MPLHRLPWEISTTSPFARLPHAASFKTQVGVSLLVPLIRRNSQDARDRRSRPSGGSGSGRGISAAAASISYIAFSALPQEDVQSNPRDRPGRASPRASLLLAPSSSFKEIEVLGCASSKICWRVSSHRVCLSFFYPFPSPGGHSDNPRTTQHATTTKKQHSGRPLFSV